MSDKLKPCPFCGSKDLEFYVGGRYGFVGCNQCDCDSAMTDDAIAAWNRRTDPVKAQLIEALKATVAYRYSKPVPWANDHECNWCNACVDKMHDLQRKALAAAEADDGAH